MAPGSDEGGRSPTEIADGRRERGPGGGRRASRSRSRCAPTSSIAGVRSDAAAQLYGPDLEHAAGARRRSRRGAEGRSRRRRRPRRADRRAHLPAHPPGPRAARALRAHRRGRQPVTETMAVGRTVGEVFEKDRRFAHRRQDRARLPRRPRRRSARCRSSRRSVRSSRSATSPTWRSSRARRRSAATSQSRRLIVEFNVRGRDVVSAVDDARAAVAARVPLPAGYRIEWGGQFQQLRRRPAPAWRSSCRSRSA